MAENYTSVTFIGVFLFIILGLVVAQLIEKWINQEDSQKLKTKTIPKDNKEIIT